MDWLFDEWVKGTAIPSYHVTWKAQPAAQGGYAVHFHVLQEHVPADFEMFVLVTADLGQNRFAHFRVPVHGAETDFASPVLPSEPRVLTFNDLHSVLGDVKVDH